MGKEPGPWARTERNAPMPFRSMSFRLVSALFDAETGAPTSAVYRAAEKFPEGERLAFWPDPDGRDLDLAPWTRAAFEQATIAEWRWRRSVENGATTNAGTQFAMNRLGKLVGGW